MTANDLLKGDTAGASIGFRLGETRISIHNVVRTVHNVDIVQGLDMFGFVTSDSLFGGPDIEIVAPFNSKESVILKGIQEDIVWILSEGQDDHERFAEISQGQP